MKLTIHFTALVAVLGASGATAQDAAPAKPAAPAPSAAPAVASQYRIANKISVEGDGSFDLLAVDEATGRVFLSHGSVVQVVDTATGKLAGTIPDTNGVHGIALAPDAGKGFITCGKDNSIAVFDLKTLAVAAHVPSTGTGPDAIAYEPATHQVFVFNGHSGNATVLDAKTNAVNGTVDLGGKPELPATDGAGTLYVNLEDKSEVVKVDAKTLKVTQTWPIAPGEEPSGLALDAANHRLFIGCHNKLMVVMNADDGKVVTTLPIGERVDGCGFDAGLHRAYSSNGDGTLTVVQEKDKDSFAVLENVTTQLGAKTLAVDGRTHRIYLPTAEYGPAPAASATNRHPRPAMKPGTFVVLTVEPVVASAGTAGKTPQ